MFCPRCGSTQDDKLRFCKGCGANLYAVRQVVDTRETSKKLGPNVPWFAEMALNDAESKRRQDELDHQRGIAPEVRRFNEIKGGVITASVGLGLAIFLHIFMKGIILSGSVNEGTAEVLSRIWVAGVIPLLIGLALIINGVFVSKKLADVVRRAARPESAPPESTLPEKETNPLELRPAETTEFVPPSYSVTEDTTKHLKS
jgi:hypothetical protein